MNNRIIKSMICFCFWLINFRKFSYKAMTEIYDEYLNKPDKWIPSKSDVAWDENNNMKKPWYNIKTKQTKLFDLSINPNNVK